MINDKILRVVDIEKEPEGFLSNIFLRPKKNGSFRKILNLRPLNEQLICTSFKMSTVNDVIRIIRPQMWLCSVDLTEAYFSLPIFREHTRFLRFRYGSEILEYLSLPNGLCSGPKIFTRISKSVMNHLRKMLINIVIYIDDTFLCALDRNELLRNLDITLHVLKSCGFVINMEKSCLKPTQVLDFLGFRFNTVDYTISLIPEKGEKIRKFAQKLIKMKRVKIRELAKLIGLFVSTFPATNEGQLHYRHLERYKNVMLKAKRNNWNSYIKLTKLCLMDIEWWIKHIQTEVFVRSLYPLKFTRVLHSDSRGSGWGSCLDESSLEANGKFLPDQMHHSINTKELLAIYYALKSFKNKLYNCNVKIFTDNKTALSALVRRGSQNLTRDLIARKIFRIAKLFKINIQGNFVSGISNFRADRSSRKYSSLSEWSLSEETMKIIKEKSIPFDIDMFATYLNRKHNIFAAFKADPEATYINAFTLDWKKFTPFIFSPFNLILRVLQKIQDDEVHRAVCVVPMFTSAIWFPQLMRMCVQKSIILPRKCVKDMRLPWNPKKLHPMAKKLRLMLVVLSFHSSGRIISLKNMPKRFRNLVGEMHH